MKLLILNYEYPPLGSGGGIISRYIAEGLASKNYTVTIITTWFEGLKEEEISGGVRIIRLKSRRKYSFQSNPQEMLSWIRVSKKFLTAFCPQEKFDFCIANFALPGGEVALFLKNRFDIPYAVISHGHDIPWVRPLKMYFYHGITYLRLKKICTGSKFNFVQTPEMKKNIDRFTGKKHSSKNIIIPNGCDFALFSPPEKRQPDKLNILFSGRLTGQKDPMTFLKALKKLSAIKIPFAVKICGDGPLRYRMEKFIAEHRLTDRVTLSGKVPYGNMPGHYRWAHMLVSPSISEGMSLTALEALACGCRVIATPISGNTSLIKENITGNFIPLKNPDALARAIELFYKEKYCGDFSVSGSLISDLKKQYSWEPIILSYDACLRNVAGM
ncbi:MAG: glycosyltransferase family 4 protein [Bacteroidetes bacterium]|nr:glycosyltransferase family 4 protein [Bacteroidota bacterium]